MYMAAAEGGSVFLNDKNIGGFVECCNMYLYNR